MGGIITAHTMVDTSTAALFFVAGPMTFGNQWQDEAITYLLEKAPKAFVATPQRVIAKEFLEKIVQGDIDNKLSQRPWENIYMHRAMEEQPGCLIFWLPKPTWPALPCEMNEMPTYASQIKSGYAKTTGMELGETIARIQTLRELGDKRRLSVVFGREPAFPGIRPIETDLRTKAGHPPLYDTLKETCDAAIRMAIV